MHEKYTAITAPQRQREGIFPVAVQREKHALRHHRDHREHGVQVVALVELIPPAVPADRAAPGHDAEFAELLHHALERQRDVAAGHGDFAPAETPQHIRDPQRHGHGRDEPAHEIFFQRLAPGRRKFGEAHEAEQRRRAREPGRRQQRRAAGAARHDRAEHQHETREIRERGLHRFDDAAGEQHGRVAGQARPAMRPEEPRAEPGKRDPEQQVHAGVGIEHPERPPEPHEPGEPGNEDALPTIRRIVERVVELRIAQERIERHLRVELAIEAPAVRRIRIHVFRRGAVDGGAAGVELRARAQEFRDAILRRPHARVNVKQKQKRRPADERERPPRRLRRLGTGGLRQHEKPAANEALPLRESLKCGRSARTPRSFAWCGKL
jgi:hypothetical protein